MLNIDHRTRNYWISLILNCCREVAHFFNPWFRALTNIEYLGITSAKYWISRTVTAQYWITLAVIVVYWTTLTDTDNYCVIHILSSKLWISHKVTAEHGITSAHSGAQWINYRMTAKHQKKSHLSAVFWSKIQNYSMQKDDVPLFTRLFMSNAIVTFSDGSSISYLGDCTRLWILESVWMFESHTVVIHT